MKHLPGLTRSELNQIPQLPNRILKKISKRDSLEKVDRDVIDTTIQLLKESKLRKMIDERK